MFICEPCHGESGCKLPFGMEGRSFGRCEQCETNDRVCTDCHNYNFGGKSNEAHPVLKRRMSQNQFLENPEPTDQSVIVRIKPRYVYFLCSMCFWPIEADGVPETMMCSHCDARAASSSARVASSSEVTSEPPGDWPVGKPTPSPAVPQMVSRVEAAAYDKALRERETAISLLSNLWNQMGRDDVPNSLQLAVYEFLDSTLLFTMNGDPFPIARLDRSRW